jgi:hypothetical protein
MTPEQQAQGIAERQETKGALQTEESANGEQTTLDGFSGLTFASDTDLEKVLELFWYDVRFRAMPREHVGGRKIIVPTEVVERLRQENSPFEVRTVPRVGNISGGELSCIRYKKGMMTGVM